MGSFMRRVKTPSGATAVQIVHKHGRRVVGIDHIGTAHDENQLALLEETANQRLHAGQQVLDLEIGGWRPVGAENRVTASDQRPHRHRPHDHDPQPAQQDRPL